MNAVYYWRAGGRGGGGGGEGGGEEGESQYEKQINIEPCALSLHEQSIESIDDSIKELPILTYWKSTKYITLNLVCFLAWYYQW